MTLSNSKPQPAAARRWLTRIAFVLLAGSAGVVAAMGMHHGSGFAGWHHGDELGTLASPAERAAHVDRMLQHVYAETGATDEQKRQLEPILRRGADELIPLHQSMSASHALAHELLSVEKVDRAALEALRHEHLQTADQASRILVELMADISDVLTPAQRKRLLERMAQQHGGGHG